MSAQDVTPLEPVVGPLAADRLEGSAAGLGPFGTATRELVEAGFVPPDLLTGMTLFLLAGQPRKPRPDATRESQRKTPIDGSVWVREQATFHRPIAADEPFRVEGSNLRQYVRKGRRYGVTQSTTVGQDGRRCVTNLTTGLLRYAADAADDATADETDGELMGPSVDPERSAANPHRATLSGLAAGHEISAEPTVVDLALMRVRDGENASNPIHSDAEAAARTGLAAPIAGGSHVLGFVFELVMRTFGPESLLHGTHLDVRWRRPVFAGTSVEPRAVVESVDDATATVSFEVPGAEGPHLLGTLQIPVG